VVGCWCGYLSGARCRLAYGPDNATATHCQTGFAFLVLAYLGSPGKRAVKRVCMAAIPAADASDVPARQIMQWLGIHCGVAGVLVLAPQIRRTYNQPPKNSAQSTTNVSSYLTLAKKHVSP